MGRWEIRYCGQQVMAEFDADTPSDEILASLSDDFDETASLHWVPDQVEEPPPRQKKRREEHMEGPTH